MRACNSICIHVCLSWLSNDSSKSFDLEGHLELITQSLAVHNLLFNFASGATEAFG